MPFSDAELERIYGNIFPTLSSSVEEPEPQVTETGGKRLKQVANIAPKGINSVFAGIQGVAGMIDPLAASDPLIGDNVLPSFDTGPSQGLTDFALDRLAPELAGWMVPYAGVSKVTKAIGAVGAGGVLAEALGQGTANIVMGAQHPESDPLLSGGVGVASGALQAGLPRWARLAPLAAVSAVEGVAHDNWVGAGANFAFNMLPGALKGSITVPKFTPKYELRGIVDDSHDITYDSTTLDDFDLTRGLARHADTSGLRLGQGPIPAPSRGGLPFVLNPETSHLNLQGRGEITQPDLPMFLGEPTRAPIASELNPGEFRFIDDLAPTSTTETQAQPELFGDTGLNLGRHPLEEQLPLQNIAPSGQNLSPYKFEEQIVEPVGEMESGGHGLRLDVPERMPNVQDEFPLIKLQGEGTDPLSPNFILRDGTEVSSPDAESLGLFDWRNEAVNQKPKTPLLEWNEPTTPKNTTPPEVGPTAPAATPPVAPARIEPTVGRVDPTSPTATGLKMTAQITHEGQIINVGRNVAGKFESQIKDPKTGEWMSTGLKNATRKGVIEQPKKFVTSQKAEKSFPQSVKDAIEKVPETGRWGPKPFISEVWKAWKQDGGKLDLEGFKAQLKQNFGKEGLEMSRADMDHLMPQDMIRDSHFAHMGDDFHFVSTREHNDAFYKNRSASTPKVIADPVDFGPEVMNPDGDLSTIAPRQQGPHIISTVLDEGDGVFLSGNKWNTPHQKGEDSIFIQNAETASGVGKSGFLIQDEQGIIRVTQDRAEAARIAEAAGQRAPDKKGALQSEDLIDPVTKSEPKTINQHIVAEAVKDSKQLEVVKATQSKIAELQQELKFAMEEGDEITVRGISSAIKKMRRASEEAGAISTETALTLSLVSAAGVGGVVAYQQSKGDIGTALAAAVIIAGLGIGGAKMLRDLKGIKGPEVKVKTTPLPHESMTAKMANLAMETKRTGAGLAVGGRGGLVNSTLLGAEDMFGLNRQAWYRDLKVKSGGFVDEILHLQAAALKKVAKVKTSTSFAEATGRYLRGQLNDPVEVQRLLNSGGIISSEGGAWQHLSATEKAKYPEKWMQLDDQMNTNTKGEEVTIWHVTNSVKQQLIQGEQDMLKRLAVTPDDQQFFDYAVETRKNFDTLMQTIHAAAGPKEARRLMGTMGQYITRSHALISDPKFYPDDATIQTAMDNLAHYKTDSFLSSVESGAHTPAAGAPSTNLTIGGKTYIVTPQAKDLFENLYTPESLRAIVTQQIKEIKSYGEAVKQGVVSSDAASLTGGLFTGRKEIDIARQALLGTHTAPQEMIRATFNKLLPSAHSAHQMLELTTAKEASGLAGRFASDLEYTQAVRRLKDQISLTHDPVAKRGLQSQLNELSAYMPVSSDNPSMGLFQGSYVSRHVFSQLDDIMNPFGALEEFMGTGFKKFNEVFKETHLVWNPVVQARNAVQIPAMLVLGRAAHDVKAMTTAFDIVFKNHTSDIARWAVRNGSMSGNPVKGEFNFNMRELLDGSADGQILGKFKQLRQFLHLAYSKPDDFVRTSTFIAAARREAKRLGVPEDQMHLNQAVTDAARTFMNRRTMDYANVPKWVKEGRQIPLVSPFLTYAHEIVRITKNAGVDAAKGDLVTAAGLAGLSVFPFLAQSQAEDSLSSVDRAAWNKGQAAAQDYSRPRFKLPVSRNKDGTFNYYDITPLMPFGDYLMMGRSLAKGDVRSALQVNPIAGVEKSPLLNLAAAQVAGKDIHTQREFRDSWDRAKNILQAISPPLTPGIGADWARTAPEALGGKIGQTNVKTGRTFTIKGALMRNIIGMDESQINPDMAVATMVKIAQHDIANERQYLNDVLKSQGISKEAQQRAINRYSEAVRHISDQLQQRLNPNSL